MIMASPIWAFLIGAILGIVIVGLLLKVRLTQKAAEAVQTCRSELGVLEERIRAKERSYDHLLIKNQELEKELDHLRDSLTREGQEKVAALKELEQLPELKNTLRGREQENLGLREEISRLKQLQAELETRLHQERLAVEEKLSLLDEASQKMSDAFKALSSECLRSNNQQFLALARATLEKFQTEAKGDLAQRQKAVETLVAPLKETLERYAQQVQSMEQARQQAYGSLSQHLKQMATAEEKLQQETGNLVKALRAPQVRGRWGEITLRRVAELAGLSEHCDFVEQETVPGETGRLRPDMVVRLPNRKMVVVDSKAPLQAFLDSLESQTEEERKIKLQEHARQVQTHLQKLSAKAYWDQFSEAPEFVVLFLPGENFFSAALEQNPRLIEEGVNQRVILATPTTLIALLKAVAYGWRQEQLAENAQAISDLGKLLYDRLAKVARHFTEVGRSLDRCVHAYNEAVGSLETRVLTAARRFREMGVSSKEDLPVVPPAEKISRALQAPEFCPPGEEPDPS
jgi:DNA recombination protein RmuC